MRPAPTTFMERPLASRPSSVDVLRLNSRDLEVLTLVTWGRTNQEIADELFVSVTTAKSYIRFAYRKIGATRRTQAVVWGFRNGLFPIGSTAVQPRP